MNGGRAARPPLRKFGDGDNKKAGSDKGNILTRLGGGFAVEMSESRLMEALTAGNEDAAEKLKLAVSDLTDPVIMTDVRKDLQLGSVTPLPGCAKGIEAKLRIAEVLDIEMNCIRRMQNKDLL